MIKKNEDIVILHEGAAQELDDTTLITEGKNPINFIQNQEKDLFWVYTIMEATVSYLLILQK